MERQGLVPYLHCPDAGALADFLVAHLGFAERGRWLAADGTVRNIELDHGATEVWLDGDAAWWAEHDDGTAARHWTGIWVDGLDDVDAAHARLTAAGIEVSDPVTREFGVRMCELTDPAGHRWALMARTPA